MPGSRPEVALISGVGFAAEWHPLGISILKEQLERRTNVGVRNFYLSSEVGHHIRQRHPALWETYCWFAEEGESYHELFYAAKLFGHATAEELIGQAVADRREGKDIYQNGHDGRGDRHAMSDVGGEALRLCEIVDGLVERMLGGTDWRRFAVIGFSCLQAQLFGSAYMASELRRRGYRGAIVFGGGMFRPWNAEQYRRLFPYVDAVVVGNGFGPIIEILRGRGERVRVAARGAQSSVGDFTDLPRRILRSNAFWTPVQLAEGCSWSRCLFCAIPTVGRAEGQVRRVAGWIRRQKAEYGCRRFGFVDWDLNGEPEAFNRLAGGLARIGGLRLFGMFNTSEMSRRMARGMRRAGFQYVLLGVESFSDRMLARMGKRARVVDNVKAIKWLGEEGLAEVWFDLITCFPGFDREAVRESVRTMERIAHLLAVDGVQCCLTRWKFERDSKAFIHRKELGIRAAGNFEFYRRCFPEGLGAGPKLHICRYRGERTWSGWHRSLKALDGRRTGGLTAAPRRGGGVVIDRRNGCREVPLDREEWKIYRHLCDTVASRALIGSRLGLTREVVGRTLAKLAAAKLIIRSGGRVFGLATRGGERGTGRIRLLEWY